MASLFKRLLMLGDVAYFTMLPLRAKPVLISVEGFIYGNNGKPTAAGRIAEIFKKTLVAIVYCEFRNLRDVPEGGGHFIAITYHQGSRMEIESARR